MRDIKEEEEPEGEVVAGPSREDIVYNSGNMLPISLTLIIIIILCTFFQPLHYKMDLHFISCADDSESEEETQVGTKEEEELGILCSWMEMGSLLMLGEAEVQILLWEVGSLFLPDSCMASLFWLFFLYFPSHISIPLFLFPGSGSA